MAGKSKNKKTNLPLSLFVGMLILAMLAGVIVQIEYLTNTTLLMTDGERVTNYLQLMSISFSVTFITTGKAI